MKKVLVVMLALIASIGAITAVANGKPGKKAPKGSLSAELREGLKNKGIFTHLQKFQQIADNSGGNRASGFPGYDKSANYVAKKLKNYGFRVTRQEFDFIAYEQDAPSTFEQISPDRGDLRRGHRLLDHVLFRQRRRDRRAGRDRPDPAADARAELDRAAARPSDFTGTGVSGKIALMQRGTCDFVVKVENAEAAGAIGSVIFNEGQPPDRTDVVFGTLGTPVGIPAVDTSFALGNDFANGVTERGDRDDRSHRHRDDLDAGNDRERDRRDEARRPAQRRHGRSAPRQRSPRARGSTTTAAARRR